MVVEILVICQLVAIVVAVPLLRLYLKERVSNLAREATDKALADHQHRYDVLLATVNAGLQRKIQEHGLYAAKRHRIYAALYRAAKETSDRFAAIFGLSMGTNLRDFDAPSAEEYFKRRTVTENIAREIRALFTAGRTEEARHQLQALERQLDMRDAGKAFGSMKNLEALNELYLSDPVRDKMATIRQQLAKYAVAARQELQGVRDLTELPPDGAPAVGELLHLMRNELQQGGATQGPANALPAAQGTSKLPPPPE